MRKGDSNEDKNKTCFWTEEAPGRRKRQNGGVDMSMLWTHQKSTAEGSTHRQKDRGVNMSMLCTHRKSIAEDSTHRHEEKDRSVREGMGTRF